MSNDISITDFFLNFIAKVIIQKVVLSLKHIYLCNCLNDEINKESLPLICDNPTRNN